MNTQRLNEDALCLLGRMERTFGAQWFRAIDGTKGHVRLLSLTADRGCAARAGDLAHLQACGLVVMRSGEGAISPSGFSLLAAARQAPPASNAACVASKPGINLEESPLGWLSSRRNGKGQPYLEPYETEAGERLRQDFTIAGLSPRIAMSWAPAGARPQKGSHHAADLADFRLDARRRLEKALMALEPNLRGLVLDICCFLKGLEQVERERCWPRRSAKLVLKIALSQLACHYGLLPRQASAGTRHWGGEGYRPTISPE